MKRRINLFELLGILLIISGIGLFVFSRIHVHYTQHKMADITAKIEAVLPESTPAVPEDRSDPVMPALQINGTDYAAILKIPAYGLTVPVANEWGKLRIFSSPARFAGSVYDNTMIIGGNDQAGQFDFFDRMNPGDHVSVTDMLGMEYSYVVDRIDRAGSADYEKLSSDEYSLTLFVRSAYEAQYILVRCKSGS